jgi:hypothetical protein
MEKLTVTFTQKDPENQEVMYGWIRIIFECKGENCGEKRYVVWVSDVFPPFNEFMNFLEAICYHRFPAECYVDTEGLIIKFAANKTDTSDAIEFKLFPETCTESDRTTPEIYFQGTFNHKEFLSEIVNKYRWFLENDYNPSYWNVSMGGFITFRRLEKLEKMLSKY